MPQPDDKKAAGVDQLDLSLSLGARFKDRALEAEYISAMRPREMRALRRVFAVLVLAFAVYIPFWPEAVLPLFTVSLVSLVLASWKRTQSWFARRVRIAVNFLCAVASWLIITFAVQGIDPDRYSAPLCFMGGLYWSCIMGLMQTVTIASLPALEFVDLVFWTIPTFPFIWTLGASYSVFPPQQHANMAIMYLFWLIIIMAAHRAHIERRRTFFLLRRLRADNVVVRLSRESPLDAIAGAFRRDRTTKVAADPAESQPQPWMIDAAQIDRSDEKLGAGAFGQVVKAQWRGTTVAVKALHTAAGDLQAQQDFQEEIALLFALRHPNVVLFMGVAVDAEQLLLVTEFVPDGSLADVLDDPDTRLTAGTQLNFALETARGMQYLHANEPPILHRDLKPQNLLVDGAHIKIADFGLSGGTSSGAIGTAVYMPPEALAGEAMTKAGDMYSFGICLNQIWARKDPFTGEHPMETVLLRVATQTHRPKIGEGTPTAIGKLIRECWAHAAEERPSFAEVSQRLVDEAKACDMTDVQSVFTAETASDSLLLKRGPRGRVAVVALDVDGMVERWTRAPQATATLCMAIGRTVRAAVSSLKAHLARSEGGSYLIVLERTQDATTLVEQIWRALQDEADIDDEIKAGLRAGVHVGDVLVDNGQYFGPTVARAVELGEESLGGELAWSSEYEAAHGSGRGVQDKTQSCWRRELGGQKASLGRSRKKPLPSLLTMGTRPAFPWVMRPGDVALDKVLGTGPVGEVTAGLLADGTRVAVKRLHAKRMNEASRLAFLGQIGALVKLRHRNVVSVLGAMLPPPSFCVVSALLGRSVRDVLDGGATLSVSRMRADVSAGLAYLHGQSIVHGRLTSHNVIMAGGDGRLCVCDYGFQQVAADTMSLTQSVDFWWTAPEVLMGGSAPTPASDVYSLGIVLWEAGTGREPYEHLGRMAMMELMTRIIGGERPPMHAGQFGDDQSFIEAAMDAEPSKRPRLQPPAESGEPDSP